MPISSYFTKMQLTKMQLIKMQLMSHTECKVPSTSAVLEKRCSSMPIAVRFLTVLTLIAFDTLI